MKQSEEIRAELSRADVRVGKRRDLGLLIDGGSRFVRLGNGDAFSKEVHAAIGLEDVGADCADRHRPCESIRLFKSHLLAPARHAEDASAAAAVMSATAHREVGATVEAVWRVLIFDPDLVESVGRTRLFHAHY